jgi:hypothetical protein
LATYKNFYTRQGLWTLFLMCALPLHIWTIILGFRDFDWIAARTNSWDAVGVVSYGLLFALFESVVVFGAIALVGFLLPAKWDEKRRVAILSLLMIVLSLWSMFNQAYFLNEWVTPEWLANLVMATGRPLVALYALAFGFDLASVALPVYFTLRSDKFLNGVQEGIERLSLLMLLYFVFDAAAIINIILRNL